MYYVLRTLELNFFGCCFVSLAEVLTYIILVILGRLGVYIEVFVLFNVVN